MKHFILFILTLFISVCTVNAKDVKTYEDLTTIKKVLVQTPCRIIYCLTDTTSVRTKKDSNVKFEIKNDILYIKPKTFIDYNDNSNEDLPVIQIFTKEVLPISSSSSFNIIENNIKKTSKESNEATIASRN